MKNKINILSWIYGICGSLVVIMYLAYLVKLFMFPEGTLAYTIAIVVPLLVILPVLTHKFLKRILKKSYVFFKALFCFGMCFYLLTFCLMCVYIYGIDYSKNQELPQDSVILVFGAKVHEHGVGQTVKKRLDTAIELLNEHEEIMCVVSGGQGVDEPDTEAAVMKEYLLENGISEDRILIEDKAKNTKENITKTIDLLQENKMQQHTVVCISNTFHLGRIKMMCKSLNLDALFVSASDERADILLTCLVREYMSYAHFILFGW